MMSKSIISNEKVCLICKTPLDLHRHHIFYGTANRTKSERFGCWVYLCARHHNMSDDGVHFNRDFDRELKKLGQHAWEHTYGTREDFIHEFGRNYL